MNRARLLTIPTLSALLTGAGLEAAQDPTLTVGDPAPKLQVSKWVQGDPVQTFDRDKVYLVEFWATWCGPCRFSIPHLNKLHNQYRQKGLIVIGQDIWEQNQDDVQPFVKKMGDQMSYRVALDTITPKDKGAMAGTWMEAAGQDGIPTAFLVDQHGRIAWIGHPMYLKEPMIEQLLEGSYDITKAASEYRDKRKTDAQLQTLESEFRRQRENQEWAQAESTLAKIETLMPIEERDGLNSTRFNLLLQKQDYAKAYKLAAQLGDSQSDDPMALNGIAWDIVTQETVTSDGLDIAETLARRAHDATQGRNEEILDTLARVLFMKGNKADAIAMQQKAVALAEGDRQQQFQSVLDDYQHDKLPNIAVVIRLRRDLKRHFKKKDWAQAEVALNELEKYLSKVDRDDMGLTRFYILAGRGDYTQAYQWATQLGETYAKDPMKLNNVAWTILTRDGLKERNLDLAEAISRRANEATHGSNAEILDTLARALFMKGQKDAALEFQARAVENAAGRRKQQFQETLDSFKQGKLPPPY